MVEDAAAESVAARAYLHADLTGALRFPWPCVDAIVGPIRNHYLTLVGADTGSGKTTVLLHLLEAWQAQGKRVTMLSLEFDPYLMRLYWAALATGLDPRPIVRHGGNGLPPEYQAQLDTHLTWQSTFTGVRFAYLWDMGELPAVFREAMQHQTDVLLIDHLQAIRLIGPGGEYDRYVELCRMLKELVRESQVPTIAAAQFHRDKTYDRLAPYLQPRETAFSGGHVLLQQADVALGLYRPLRAGLTRGDLLLLRAGQGNLRAAISHETVGVICLKHRWDDQRGTITRLRYRHGHLTDEEPDESGDEPREDSSTQD